MRVGTASRNGPVLVFLHEGLGCVSMWRDFPQRLCEATGLLGISYSRLGYGASSGVHWPRPKTYMHHEALSVLPELLQKLEISDAILIGHSDGASVSLIHGGSGCADRVRGMIVLAPHVIIEDETVQAIGSLTLDYERGDLRSRLARHHGANVDCAFYGFAKTWLNPDNAKSWNIEDYVKAIQVPILVIQGEDDKFGTLRQVEMIREAAPDFAEAVVIPKCGHHPHFAEPGIVVDRCVRFIQRVVG